jgi:cobalt-zinc-cadmium efflux system outer membrane protein
MTSSKMFRHLVIAGVLIAALMFASGCVLAPKGMKEQQHAAELAGRSFKYDQPFDSRKLPDLPQEPTWRDVLQRAFLTNGDLEAAYFDWRGALARIPQVATYPNSNLAPSFSYLFSGGRMKAWDRTTVSVGFDPMQNLSFPTKVSQAGKVALEQARASGRRFAEAKFELQRKVLTAYLDLALHEQKIRIQTDNVSLLKLLADTAAERVKAGGNQQEMLRAQTQYRLAENELANMKSGHMAMQAMLNGMIGRPHDAALNLPPGLPAPRAVAVDDAQLIASATDESPELARLAHEVSGRSDALELARMGFIPDINPFAAFTGGVSQTIGAMVIVPTTIPEIRGRIDEAKAALQASEATLRQARSDRAASFVAALYVMRNSERQVEIFRGTILPRAEQAMASSRQAYATGQGTFIDLIDTQRTLLEVRLMIVEAQVEREKRLAELEALAGIDIETLTAPTTAPATTNPSIHEEH